MKTKIKTFIIKTFIFTFIAAGFFTTLPAQNGYYDALEFTKKEYNGSVENGKVVFDLTDLEKIKEFFKILAPYAGLNKNSTLQEVKDAYSGNPFLSLEKISIPSGFAPEKVEELPQPISPSVSGISVTTIAEGMAKFLVERVKEELSVAFFQKFQKAIIDGKNEYLKILQNLFPETFKILKTIDDEIYKFSSFIQVLREAFAKDLSNGLPNIRKVIDEGCLDQFFINNSELKKVIIAAIEIVNRLKNGDHPVDIILNKDIYQLLNNKENLVDLLKGFEIISNSIRDTTGDRYWVDSQSLKKLFKKDENYKTFKIYLGLLWQSAGEQFGDFRNKLMIFKDKAEAINSIVNHFALKVNAVDTLIVEIRKKKSRGEKPTYNDYYNFYRETLNTLEFSAKLVKYVFDKDDIPDKPDQLEPLNGKIKNYFIYAGIIGDIYLDANQRNYSSLIFNVIRLLDEAIGPDSKKYEKIRNGILKYGGFMAAVASAENSDQVQEAIKAVALPAGSSSIKRNSSINVSLNAYVGFALRKDEDIEGEEESKMILGFNRARVWAPIGVALSFGKMNFLCIDSFSLFGSVIDIGAVTAFRFQDESTEDIPKFTLKNIVSPGIHAVFGLKKLPISLGVGYQRAPQLRKIVIGDEGNDITESGWKWNIFIGVDIPLLNFYTN